MSMWRACGQRILTSVTYVTQARHGIETDGEMAKYIGYAVSLLRSHKSTHILSSKLYCHLGEVDLREITVRTSGQVMMDSNFTLGLPWPVQWSETKADCLKTPTS
jgi:hypothetical protein